MAKALSPVLGGFDHRVVYADDEVDSESETQWALEVFDLG